MENLRITLRKRDNGYILINESEFIKHGFRYVLIEYLLENLNDEIEENEALYDFIRANDYNIETYREAPNYNRVYVSATLPAGPLLNSFNCNIFTARANDGLLDEFFERYDLDNFEVFDCAILVEGGKRHSSKRRTSVKKTLTKKVSSKRRTNGGKRRSSHRRRF